MGQAALFSLFLLSMLMLSVAVASAAKCDGLIDCLVRAVRSVSEVKAVNAESANCPYPGPCGGEMESKGEDHKADPS